MPRQTYSAAVSSSHNLNMNQSMANQPNTNTNTANTTTNSIIDVFHPYFLQSSDNPGIALVTQPLTAQNYQHWSRSIKLALSAKNKIGMIDGTLVKPEVSSPLYAFWHRCNDMVLSWLLNSISSDIRDSVVYFSTAREIWEDLTVRFSQSNVPRIFQLKKDLNALNQGSMSVTAYFTKMRTLTDELNALAPIPKCVCVQNSCTCEVSAKLETYEQIDRLSQFLMGLNDTFTATRGQMLMMKPLPSLSQAYSLLLQEENQRSTPLSTVPENVAMNVKFTGSKTRSNYNSYKKSNSAEETCEYCHNTGHLQDKCFFLHGYPDWHRLHGKPKPKLRSPGTSVKKVAQVTVSSVDNADPSCSDSSKSAFSDAQCEQLSRMIQNSMKNLNPWSTTSQLSGKICNVSFPHTAYTVQTKMNQLWILDSGATDHIVSDVSFLSSAKPFNAVLHLPNGTTAPITHIGDVTFTSSLILTDVLCVPSFQCNLVSISKLTADSSATVLFSKSTCLFQDPSLKQMVEIGKVQAGGILTVVLLSLYLIVINAPDFITLLLLKLKSGMLD